MSRFFRFLIIFWIVCIAISGVIFSFLSTHPDTMLWIEDIHPSSAYERGRELKQQKRFKKAIEFFKKGRNYYKKIFDETRLERHKRLYVQGILEMANIYAESELPNDLEQAATLYAQALKLLPDSEEGQGQPYLAQGFVLQRLGRHPEAILSFSSAVDWGSALIALQAMLGRGDSCLETGQTQKACDDWYLFARYYDRITDRDWETLLKLSVLPDIRSEYILGRAYYDLLKKDKAKPHLKRYFQRYPNDRSARFWYGHSTGIPLDFDRGTIELTDCFPQNNQIPLQISSTIVDLFVERRGSYDLILSLSGGEKSSELNKAFIYRNRSRVAEIVLTSSTQERYSTIIELERGANYIQIESNIRYFDTKYPGLFLHALEIKPVSS